MHRFLPKLAGLQVLDLGCGFGDFARFAREQGATAVTGVDISSRMLEAAKALGSDGAIRYLNCSIEAHVPEEQSCDLVVSSLALHYVADYASLVGRVYRALKPGGRFVFSVEHPMCTAAPTAWVLDAYGRRLHWPVDQYRQEGRRETRWFVEGVVKYHRSIESYVNGLLAAGFQLEHLGEPAPIAHALAARSELQDECRRPPFLLLAAARPVTERDGPGP